MPPTDEPGRDRATELALQQAQIDVLSAKLNKAERAVAQARTPAAAAEAHRRADALLLELEAAEDTFRTLEQTLKTSVQKSPSRGQTQPYEQGHLFNTG